MKKIRLTLVVSLAFLATGTVSCGDDDKNETSDLTATVSASSTPQEKNVLVEHFTGIKDPLSSDGHRILNGLKVNHPGRVFCINIHTGTDADNTYTTDFGAELAEQSHLTSYPAGTVNRLVFETYAMDTENTGTAMDRSYWANAANLVMLQSSDANLNAKAVIDPNTRELTVAVAIYYVSKDTNDTNISDKLNVALVEDSVWGRQNGGSTYNPSHYDFGTSLYCHMDMLRHLLTGQWGDDITPVVGTQIRRSYKYTIPEQISGVDVNLKHLKVIVFLAEGQQEIINVCQAPITF